MKVRNGFVSNSSSSSFIVIGVKMVSGDFNFIEQEIEDNDGINEILEERKIGYQCDYENDTYYVGKVKYLGEYEFGSMPFPSNEEVQKIIEKINSVRKNPISLKDIKIHSGAIYS